MLSSSGAHSRLQWRYQQLRDQMDKLLQTRKANTGLLLSRLLGDG